MKKIILLFALFFSPQFVSGQFITSVNPANVDDPRLYFVNPAGLGRCSAPVIIAGYRKLYAGLANDNLQNGLIGFVYPTGRYGAIGLTSQTFRSFILRESAIDVRYALNLNTVNTALGLNIGVLGRSYDKADFNLVNPNDPLLQGDLSLYAFNIGFGAVIEPVSDLLLGFSADHINQPTVSLQGGATKPFHLRAGLMMIYKNSRPQIMWEQEDGRHYFSFGTDFWLYERFLVRAFMSSEQLSVGAGFVYNKFRLDYLYDYPLTDLSQFVGGTHLFVANYSFDQPEGDFSQRIESLIPLDAVNPGIYPGENALFTIKIEPIGNFENLVDLYIKDVPKNMDAALRETRIQPGDTTILVVQPKVYSPSGMIEFNVLARSGRLKHRERVLVNVRQPSQTKLRPIVFTRKDTLQVGSPTKVTMLYPEHNFVFIDENEFRLKNEQYEILNAHVNPLLNFVYFREHSANLQAPYPKALKQLALYLKNNPSAQIKISGYNNHQSERDNFQLSKQRAENVRDYLFNFGDIKPEQIMIEWSGLSPRAARERHPQINEENQRVEITPIEDDNFFPPSMLQFLQGGKDTVCVFHLWRSIVECGVKNWRLWVWTHENDGARRTVWTSGGDRELPRRIRWHWTRDLIDPSDFNRVFYFDLFIADQCANSAFSAVDSFYIQIRPTENFEKTRLILLHFDTNDISLEEDVNDINKDHNILKGACVRAQLDSIANLLLEHAYLGVKINGYTDITGSFDYNKKLSQKRAETVRDYLLERFVAPEQIVCVEGHGETLPLLPNSSPAGRLLNRRVEILVKPIEQLQSLEESNR